jgi:UDP-4-keto-D-FucNAc 4-reductase
MIRNIKSDMQRILITGANGFLGSEIVRQALYAGKTVRASDQGEICCISGVDYCRANILEPASLIPAIKGMDAVIHAAGLAHIFDKSQSAIAPFKDVNEIGTANLASAAAHAGAQHFVLVSSVSVYGSSARGIDETACCNPKSDYSKSKLQAEQRATQIALASGMNLTILRLATLYGEGDPGNVARLMRTIDRGRFVMVGSGSNRKSLIHREDAARACLMALSATSEAVNIYNVSAPPCMMRDVVMELSSALGQRLSKWRIPAFLALVLTGIAAKITKGQGSLGVLQDTIQKWLADDYYSTEKFQRQFSFEAQIALSKGLRREVQSHKARGDTL